MTTLYPPNVDECKTKISGSPNYIGFGMSGGMVETENQYHEVGHRLAALREGFSQMSQKAWAEKHGFNPTQYNNWERGVRRIPVDDAERLCSLYGVTLDFIYRGRRDGLSETSRNLL